MTRKSDDVRPGPRNLISDVEGISVGNAENWLALTGTTVILPDKPAVAAVEIGGGAPGSRETAVNRSAVRFREILIELKG